MISVNGKCLGRWVRGRFICRAKSMEHMEEGCQFYRPEGLSCRNLSMGSYRRCKSALAIQWTTGQAELEAAGQFR